MQMATFMSVLVEPLISTLITSDVPANFSEKEKTTTKPLTALSESRIVLESSSRLEMIEITITGMTQKPGLIMQTDVGMERFKPEAMGY